MTESVDSKIALRMKLIDDSWNHSQTYTLADYDAETKDGKEHTIDFYQSHMARCIAPLSQKGTYVVQMRQEQGDGSTISVFSKKELQDKLDSLAVQVARPSMKGTVLQSMSSFKIVMDSGFRFYAKCFRCVKFVATEPGDLQLWDGFPFTPVHHPGACDMFMDLIRHGICGEEPWTAEVLLSWAANMYQHPESRNHFAVFCTGPTAVGKSTVGNVFCNLWGLKYASPSVCSMKTLTGEFSLDACENKKLIVGNEL
jgi:hypothetical protein